MSQLMNHIWFSQNPLPFKCIWGDGKKFEKDFKWIIKEFGIKWRPTLEIVHGVINDNGRMAWITIHSILSIHVVVYRICLLVVWTFGTFDTWCTVILCLWTYLDNRWQHEVCFTFYLFQDVASSDGTSLACSSWGRKGWIFCLLKWTL